MPEMEGQSSRRIPLAEQRRRTIELDALRLLRPLTEAERAEADALAHRAYMRAWRGPLRTDKAAPGPMRRR